VTFRAIDNDAYHAVDTTTGEIVDRFQRGGDYVRGGIDVVTDQSISRRGFETLRWGVSPEVKSSEAYKGLAAQWKKEGKDTLGFSQSAIEFKQLNQKLQIINKDKTRSHKDRDKEKLDILLDYDIIDYDDYEESEAEGYF